MRSASADESRKLWPAVAADRIFETAEEFSAYRDEARWKVRVSENGAACVLGEWRAHLDVLAMRGVWCSEKYVPAICADACDVAREQGFARLLSPLLPVVVLGGYLTAGMRVCQRVVAIQGMASQVAVSASAAASTAGIRLMPAGSRDLAEIVKLDAACFDEFWRYGAGELATLIAAERAVVARADSGELIGYTLATMSRGAATLGRLAVDARARRRGVGRALVSDVASWAAQSGAVTLGLCTQEENAASRALYAASGLHEIEDRYALAIGDVGDVS